MKSFETVYKTFLTNYHEKNLSRKLIFVEPGQGTTIKVNGRDFINFSSNDYLGLKSHPKLIESTQDFAARFGSGSGASRLVTGNISPFQEIEAKIAKLKGKEAALVLASGFQANGAVLQALFDKTVLKHAPTVVSDKLNHASMHFGCKAAGVRQSRYRHLDAEHAQSLLQASDPDHPRFCLTETVFSMDGDKAPMDQLVSVCQAQEAMLIADDAHGFGVLGEKGKGLGSKADIVIGTFSKACGSFGAYVAASQTMIDYLIQRCGGLIYSTALPPATLGAINAALDLLPDLDQERQTVANHAANFRQEMQAIGFDTGASQTQIVPLIVGSSQAALDLSETLKAQGLWASAIRPPTVPKGTARLRFAFSAAHSQQDMDQLINCLKNYKKTSGSAP